MTYRHLRAFVSSRMQELAEERSAVRAALEALHVHAFVYEVDAGARPDSARSTYLSEIDASDLYIGLFWSGYGAYTIEEYEHARLRRKPCLIYVKQDDAGSARVPELAAFLERVGSVESGHTLAWFRNADELTSVVARDVARWLASVVRSVGGGSTPFQAPALSARHVHRPELIARLRALLLPPQAGGRPRTRIAVLHGLAGSGKTSLARELAHDSAVLEALPHGVLWVSLGQQPDLRQRLSDWGRALGDGQVGMVGYPDVQTATAQLRALLAERACLLIVDDAWSADHVKAFDAGGPGCVLVVTTRQGEIASSLGAQRLGVPAMSESDALEVLRQRSGEIPPLDLAQAKQLAAEVGYLPLALDLLAAQMRRLGSWSALAQAWHDRGPRVLVRSRSAAGREDNMLDSLELSLGALIQEDRARFFELGVFEEEAAFPASAAAALWDLGAADAADLLAELVDRALLERATGGCVFSLHDLLHEVARDQLGEAGLLSAHEALLAGYRARCTQGWAACPDDGYLHEHVTAHLAAAGRREELYALIDEAWMRAQFRRGYSHRHFARDVERMIAQAAQETPPRLDEEVKGSLIYATLGSLARHVPPRTLALLVRLGQVERAKGMASLLADACERMDALIAIARALEHGGQSALAAAIAAEAVDAANGLPDSTMDQEKRREALARLAPLAARHGLLAKWRRILDATGAAMLPQPGRTARQRALLQAAVALAEAGCTPEAESIVDELQAADADARALVAPLCALARTSASPQVAVALSERALALAMSGHSDGGRDLDLMACVHTLLVLDRRDDALKTIGAMSSAGSRAYAYAAAARAATPGHQALALAARSLAQLRALVEEGDTADAARALADTFDAHVLAGDDALSAAVALALELEQSPLGGMVVGAASRALATASRYEEALGLAKRLDARYSTGTVGAIAVGFALQGDFASARKLIDAMEPIYRGPVLMELARAQQGAGRLEEACAILQDPAVQPGLRIQGLTQVAESLLDGGDSNRAADVLAAALAGAEVAGDIEGVVAALSAIAEAECARARLQSGREMALAAAAMTRRTGGWQREAATLHGACALVACGEIEAAVALIDELPEPSRLMPILVCAARLVHAGRADDARGWLARAVELFGSAATDAERRRAAAWTAQAYGRLGEVALAGTALREAESGLDSLSGWERFDAWLEIAPAAARLGDTAHALDMLRRADALIGQQTNQLASVSTRRLAVASRLADIGELEAALEHAGRIPLAGERARALTAVAAASAKKDSPGARDLLRAVLDLIRTETFGHERASALAAAAPVMHRLGMTEAAAAAREAAGIAEAANLDATLRSELRRSVAQALHACGVGAESLASWRSDLAASRVAGRARTLESLVTAVPLLAPIEDGRLLERIGRNLVTVEAWWSTPIASPAPGSGEGR